MEWKIKELLTIKCIDHGIRKYYLDHIYSFFKEMERNLQNFDDYDFITDDYLFMLK